MDGIDPGSPKDERFQIWKICWAFRILNVAERYLIGQGLIWWADFSVQYSTVRDAFKN